MNLLKFDYLKSLEKVRERALAEFAELQSGERGKKLYRIAMLSIQLGIPAAECAKQLLERYLLALQKHGDPKKRSRAELEQEVRKDVERIYCKCPADAATILSVAGSSMSARPTAREKLIIAGSTDRQWRELVDKLVATAPQDDDGQKYMGNERDWLEEREEWLRKVVGAPAPGEYYFVGGRGDAKDERHFFGAGDDIPLRFAKSEAGKTEQENAELEMRYGGDLLCPNPLREKHRLLANVMRCRYLLLETDFDFYGTVGRLQGQQQGPSAHSAPTGSRMPSCGGRCPTSSGSRSSGCPSPRWCSAGASRSTPWRRSREAWRSSRR